MNHQSLLIRRLKMKRRCEDTMADDRRERDDAISGVRNFRHRKIKRTRDSIDGVDFISSLPDAILQHIFSLIPTKFAIRTSVLSRRWRYVWTKTPSLSIDCYRNDPDSVKGTLARYSSPKIMSFHLCISNKAHQIDSLIDFAMSHNTEKMSLEFQEAYVGDYTFPESFYTNCSLKQLLVKSGTIDTIPRPTVSWTSLKTLSLRFCVLSDESCAKILSGSPLLERLTLYSCVCGKLERLDLSNSLQLKSLDVESSGPMQIVAPHIHCLRLTFSDEAQCGLVDVSSLTEANLDIYGSIRLGFLCNDFGHPETGLADSLQAMILETLEKFQNVGKLTLGGALCLQILSLAVVCGVRLPTFKVEALTFDTVICPSIIPGVAKLLQNSPGLKKIKLNIVDCDIIEERCLTNYLCWKGLDTHQCWKPKDLALSEPNLMTFFMKFLLKNSEDDYTLGRFTFSQNNNCELSFVLDKDSTPEYFYRF